MPKVNLILLVTYLILIIAAFFTGILGVFFNKKLTNGFYEMAKKHQWQKMNKKMYSVLLYLLGIASIITSIWISYILIRVFIF